MVVLLGNMPLENWECLPDVLRVQVLQVMAERHKVLEPDCLKGEVTIVSEGQEVLFRGKCLKYQGKEV